MPTESPRVRTSLRRRLLLGLLGYAVLLTAAVVAHGVIINERAERQVWELLLTSELDHFVERSRSDPDYRWSDTQTLHLYDGSQPDTLPPALRGLTPGLHDEVPLPGGQVVALVREVDGRPLVLALDITALEAHERQLGLGIALSAALLVALLGLASAWGIGRLLGPLTRLAERIAALRPDRHGQRIALPGRASAELAVIADALNGYLQRQERFVERERVFINSTSHELRTPVAVIAGAAELALAQSDVLPPVRAQLSRIRKTAREVEQLIALLLALAKDPARLVDASDRIALGELLADVVEDHRHLTADRDLVLTLEPPPPCEITAPLPMVQAAIGNLLRNAIEHSDRGRISVQLQPDATVVIDDPGHGMSPEEISALYARAARQPGRDGAGIGLDLIARLCEHLGWQLRFERGEGKGTRTILSLRTNVAPPS